MPRWTKSARKRQSQLIKQWKPWNHSTGPRTSEGKHISSQNARKCPEEIQVMLNYAKQTKTTLKKLNEELVEKMIESMQLTDDDDGFFS
ncbi:hypothetical protein VB715_19500 [Crocosphaera sp. UHCC 0190]|uniref:hypothetical protein n=1 Tax=unclassified Crocosphaera TaxID=2623705 RepID=UPI002B210974|nr:MULTISPECIES: hypothetical protein [unclassified Crocosphaera]MEA5511962.1 hypothetical protein [Crocosphaera sp. UHCC 0190]MEA5536667.1 hypothetical protein [Crocosphaera sp. XPORK-15E]